MMEVLAIATSTGVCEDFIIHGLEKHKRGSIKSVHF